MNLAVEAMNRDLGLLVLEPKGDLIADVLKHVPQRRVEEVTLLDFGDRGFPPAFNLLAGSAGQAEAVASDLQPSVRRQLGTTIRRPPAGSTDDPGRWDRRRSSADAR
jgi:hypothetical protein